MSPPKETLAKDQILVLLNKDASPTPLIKTLKAYEAIAKVPGNRSDNRWLIVYNPELIKPKKMLRKIKSFASVIEASFKPLKTE